MQTGEMTATDQQLEHRQDQFHSWGVYGLLLVSTILAVVSSGLMGTAAEWYWAGALVLAAVLLQLWHGPRRGRRTPSRRGTVYFGLRWAISFGLTWINPFFGFYAACVPATTTAVAKRPNRCRQRPGIVSSLSK